MNLINQQVKIILNNNVIVKGIIKFWDDDYAVIDDDGDILYIMSPKNNIILIQIISNRNIQHLQTQQQFEEERKNTPSDLKHQKMANLKHLLKRQEAKIINEKLNNHTIDNSQAVGYKLPNIFRK